MLIRCELSTLRKGKVIMPRADSKSLWNLVTRSCGCTKRMCPLSTMESDDMVFSKIKSEITELFVPFLQK